MLLPAFFLLVFVASSALMLVAAFPSRMEKTIQGRVTDIRNPRRALFREAGDAELDESEGSSLSERLGLYLRRFSFSAAIETLLLQANSATTVGLFAVRSLQCSAVGGFIGVVFFRSIAIFFAAATAGLLLPTLGLRRQRAKRLQAVSAALPDTADLMARSLRVGHSVTQALEVMAERAPQPLAAEFVIVFQQQKLGVPLREVLLDLGRRIPSRDLQFLITAILVQRETGGDLAEILDRTTHVLRERIRVQGEVQVHTAQGRLTGWVLSLMPVLLLAVMSLFSPSYTHILFADPMGRRLLWIGVGCIILGALVIRRILRVDF